MPAYHRAKNNKGFSTSVRKRNKNVRNRTNFNDLEIFLARINRYK